jgi:hypothetical protein
MPFNQSVNELNYTALEQAISALAESTLPFQVDLIDFARTEVSFQKIITDNHSKW